jgi:hypothetical protein
MCAYGAKPAFCSVMREGTSSGLQRARNASKLVRNPLEFLNERRAKAAVAERLCASMQMSRYGSLQ